MIWQQAFNGLNINSGSQNFNLTNAVTYPGGFSYRYTAQILTPKKRNLPLFTVIFMSQAICLPFKPKFIFK